MGASPGRRRKEGRRAEEKETGAPCSCREKKNQRARPARAEGKKRKEGGGVPTEGVPPARGCAKEKRTAVSFRRVRGLRGWRKKKHYYLLTGGKIE